jgi:hypothetical protein
MALYVYGLMRADDVREGLDLEQGENLPEVEVVVRDDLAVLVGQVQGEPVRLQREAVMAHSEVLRRAFEKGPVLPLRFGTVVPDESALERELLGPRRAQFAARLAGLEGKAEFQLKISYREEPLLRSVLAGDPALRRSAELVRGLPAAASHFDRINLGERINATVQARREAEAQALIGRLEPLAVAREVGAPQQPTMVLNASFLVASEMVEGFGAAVEDLAEQRRELMEFKLIGPLPAHSFADRDLPPAAATGAAR